MKQKIVFPTLVANLAIHTGKSKKQCEDFLRELFNTIETTLTAGESVKIKGLGTFKLVDVEPRKSVDVNTGEDIEIPGHKKITFIPARELAERVNEPFAIFESIEIPNESEENIIIDKTENIADQQESTKTTPDEPEIILHSTDISKELNPDTNTQEQEKSPQTEIQLEEEKLSEEISQPGPVVEESFVDGEFEEYGTHPVKRFRFLWGFLTGVFASIIVALGIYFFIGGNFESLISSFNLQQTKINANEDAEKVIAPVVQDTEVDTLSQNEIAITDNAEEAVPTAPSDEIIYDTISRTRYLTTMAKEHYGNYNLWPYIYMENQKILGHPDRIKPGTRVVVPKLSKYGVNPANPEDIKKAKEKGVEIYAKFQ